jgi:hypothetical protein
LGTNESENDNLIENGLTVWSHGGKVTQMPHKYAERCSETLSFKEMQSKSRRYKNRGVGQDRK